MSRKWCFLASLVILVWLAGPSEAVNSTYVSCPHIPIASLLPNSKLIADCSYLIIDPDNGLFYLNLTSYFSDANSASDLPVATAIGQVTFQLPGVIMFSYPGQNSSYCQQARSSPSLCGDPAYLLEITDGLFAFGTHPSTGNVQTLTLEAYSSNPNPDPSGPMNWLAASQAITYTCVGTCASLNAQVPPAPLPANGSFIVRRSNSRSSF